MERCLQTQKLPPITDNQITLFYFFDEEINLNKFNDKGLNIIGVPETITTAIKKRLDTDSLWKEVKYNISKDISPSIHNLFHAQDEKAITTWQIEQSVRKLFNGSTVRNLSDVSSNLSLKLNSSAQQRITSCNETDFVPKIEFENITCHQFKTGFTIAVIELKIYNDNLSHTLINETVYSLARFNKIGWLNEHSRDKYKASLGEFIRSLLNNNSKEKITRAYTHSYIQVQGECVDDDFSKYLTKLAKHYNDEYHISDKIESLKTIYDYKNIRHCLTHEGASSGVIITKNSPELLTDYHNKVIKPVHIPLHLLSYHAEKAMQYYSLKNTFWVNLTEDEEVKSSQDKQLIELKEQQLQLLNFELNFFQPVISNIGTHNQLYQQISKVKQLDKLHEKTSSNNRIISKLITERIEQQKQEKIKKSNLSYCKIAQIGVAAAGLLTSFSIVKEALEVRKHEHWLTESFPLFTSFLDHHAGAISLISSVIIAIVIFILARKHCNNASKQHSHGPAAHADHTNHLLHFLHGGKSH